MPKVKLTTRSTADLSEAYKATDDFTTSLAARNTLDYTRETAKYELEGQRLFELEKQNIKDYETAYDQALLAEKQLGTTFDDNTRETLRNSAREISNARTQAALGQGVYGEKYDAQGLTLGHADAYETIAKNERTLNAMVANTGSLFELNNKIKASNGLKEGDIGKMIYNGNGNTANLVEIVKGVFDNSGDVKYEVGKSGEPYYVKNIGGQDVKIPVELITNIMTGENAKYPIQFNEDPTESLKLIHENLAKNPEVFKTIKTREGQYLSSDGKYITTSGGKKIDIDEEAYKKAFRDKSLALLQDTEQMQTFWEVLAVSGDFQNPGYYNPDKEIDYMGQKMTMKEAAQYLAADYAANMFIVDGEQTASTASKTTLNTGYKAPTPIDPTDINDMKKARVALTSYQTGVENPAILTAYLNEVNGANSYLTRGEIENRAEEIFGGRNTEEYARFRNIYFNEPDMLYGLESINDDVFKAKLGDQPDKLIFKMTDDGPKLFIDKYKDAATVEKQFFKALNYNDDQVNTLKSVSGTNYRVQHPFRGHYEYRDGEYKNAVPRGSSPGAFNYIVPFNDASFDKHHPKITKYNNLYPDQRQQLNEWVKKKNMQPNVDIKPNSDEAVAAWNKEFEGNTGVIGSGPGKIVFDSSRPQK